MCADDRSGKEKVMGLAASQARLLTLTSRSIDLELQCMRFSAQEIRNSQKACDLSEEHNEILDWLKQRSETQGDDLYAGNFAMDSYTTNGVNSGSGDASSSQSGTTINLKGMDYSTLSQYGFVIQLNPSKSQVTTPITYPSASQLDM